jgi:hypothetical protein
LFAIDGAGPQRLKRKNGTRSQLMQHQINSRNEAFEFARRTRQNLHFIEDAASQHANVHVVTQLALSLLGLIVFPKEKLLLDEAERKTIDAMRNENWPTWTITRDDATKPTRTLADMLTHLRNAVAHGRLTFTSDSPRIEEVAIIVEDKKRRHDPEPYWRATIEARDLHAFCLRFLDFIEENTG